MALVVSGLAGCGSNPFGAIMESEGVAEPAASNKESPQSSPKTAKGFPKDDDQPTAVPDINGSWSSNWGKPISFQQYGDTAWARFDGGGRMDCAWNGKSRFHCTWTSNKGKGLAQIWWQDGGPVGRWANQNNLKEWGTLEFGPWTSEPTTTTTATGSCSSNINCHDHDTICVAGQCVSSLGKVCGNDQECGLYYRDLRCINNACMPK
jgi:hypothetical protein